MAGETVLRIEGVEKAFGAVRALAGVDLEVEEGELVCFLGPSGCGKTTLLRIIAGLERADRGCIRFAGEVIDQRPPHLRGFGMVFQSLALFPHLDVAGNIAYPLRLRGMTERARAARVRELLELVRLPGLERRRVHELSGGQRQRVALARALAAEPRLLLLDEPLSALDAKLREDMQVEVRLLQQRLGITTILVTHDQREAMTMADRVVVMNAGRIHQVGPPDAVYRRPCDRFVAAFLGRRNELEGVVEDARTVKVGAHRFTVREGPLPPPGAPVWLVIRPEKVVLMPGGEGGANRLQGRVVFVRDVGESVEVFVDCGELGQQLAVASASPLPALATGAPVTLRWPEEAIVALGA